MIIQLEEAKSKLLALESDVKELGDSLKIERLREQAKTLEAQTLAENFWNDQANSGKVLQELKRTKDKIEDYEFQKVEDAEEIKEILNAYIENYFDINDDKETARELLKND